MKRLFGVLVNGLIVENPLFVIMIGLCSCDGRDDHGRQRHRHGRRTDVRPGHVRTHHLAVPEPDPGQHPHAHLPDRHCCIHDHHGP